MNETQNETLLNDELKPSALYTEIAVNNECEHVHVCIQKKKILYFRLKAAYACVSLNISQCYIAQCLFSFFKENKGVFGSAEKNISETTPL